MSTPTTFGELVYMFGDLINVSIRFIFTVVFVYLVWKIFDTWVISAADESKREEGKQTAFVAVVVMVILLSAWGLVTLIQRSVFG